MVFFAVALFQAALRAVTTKTSTSNIAWHFFLCDFWGYYYFGGSFSILIKDNVHLALVLVEICIFYLDHQY